MRTTPILATVVGASLSFIACGPHDLVVCKKMSISELAEEEYGAQQWPEGWPDESMKCSIGEYVVVTPAANSDVDHVMLYRGADEMFVRQGGVSSIFENGRPVLDATDSNDDGTFDISDPINTLGYLFTGTGEIPAPSEVPGFDPTPDTLFCEMELVVVSGL